MQAIESITQDFRISAGLRREGYFAGVEVYGPSPEAKDELRRAAFFQKFINDMGISNRIAVFMDGDTLRMKAQEPWKLVYPSARIDGGNPSGFYACGFDGIESALAAGHRLVERYAKKHLGVGFSVRLSGDAYNQVYSRLNEWRGWEMMLIGCPLTEYALDVLRGCELTDQSPPFIPAFSWWESVMKANVYGSVLVNGGNSYLQISANGGTPEMLQERVTFLDNVRFHQVFP